MHKVIMILLILNTGILLQASEKVTLNLETKNEVSSGKDLSIFYYLPSTDKDKKIKIPVKNSKDNILLNTGIVLTAAGTTVMLIGGALIGVSNLFAWYTVRDLAYINGRKLLSVVDWGATWSIIFQTVGYSYSTLAFASLLSGIILAGLGLMFIPGIVLIVYNVVMKNKKNKEKTSYLIEPLGDSFGLSVKF